MLFTLVYQSTSADPTECAEFLTTIEASSDREAQRLAEKYMLERENKYTRSWETIVDFDNDAALFQSYVTRDKDDFPFVIGVIQVQFTLPYKG